MAVTAEGQTLTKTSPPKRKLRNFLLDARFQLKYTAMVVFVTVVVAGILGAIAYSESSEQSRNLNMMLDFQREFMSEEAAQLIEDSADEYDRKLLFGIIGGIVVLALAMGLTGIVVTHRIVGPAYKLRRLINHVGDGHLEVAGRLRKGDELKEVFDAFERMIVELRRRQESEISMLNEVIEAFEREGTRAKAGADLPIDRLVAVRDMMADELKRKSLAPPPPKPSIRTRAPH
jgi:methyl-accepting chemotaxis protein